jgi:hypothetical protein
VMAPIGESEPFMIQQQLGACARPHGSPSSLPPCDVMQKTGTLETLFWFKGWLSLVAAADQVRYSMGRNGLLNSCSS